MWEQYFQLRGFTARTSPLATTMKFSNLGREAMTDAERAVENRTFAARMAEEGFIEQWNSLVAEAVRRTACNNLLLIASIRDLIN